VKEFSCRRLLLPLALLGGALSAMGGALMSGCTSSSAGSAPDAMVEGAPPGDDGPTADGGADASAVDGTLSDGPGADVSTPDAGAGDGGADANPTDGGPTGDASDGAAEGGIVTHLLVPGSTVTIEGVTSDDYVIYYDSSTLTYYAKPLAGGPATTIYTAPASAGSGYGSVFGKVAFVWSWNSSYIGTLTTWSSGMAQGASLTTSGLAYIYQSIWASDDSRHVAYLQSTSSDATIGSLYGANADGTGATLLLANLDINSYFTAQHPTCFPRLVFRGDYAVVSSCTVADAGTTPTLQSFSISGGWAPQAIIPNWVHSLQFNVLDHSPFTFSFAVDPDGGRIAAASTSSGNGALQIFPTDGGASTVVDPSEALAASFSFTGSVNNPWSIFYNNDAGVLQQAYATNPAPQTLVDGGVNYLNALSNDGKWLLVSGKRNNNGWFADLSLVSTQTPGVPVNVASSTDYGGLPVTPSGNRVGGSRGFTADSAYAIATTNMTQSSSGSWIGYLRSMLVTAPYTTKLLTNGYMVGFAPLGASKVLVSDNFQDTDGGGSPATVDLDVVDPASAGGPVNIVQGVRGDNGLSGDQTQIAYSVTTGAAPGIYVSPLP
jgi:hypothetical protein